MSNIPTLAAGLATIVTAPEFIDDLQLALIDLHENARADPGDLAELAASIAHDGVRLPIVVYREGDRYVLWMGHRRVAASRLAGKATIPALVKPRPSPDKFLADQLVENLQREGMDDRDIHNACVRLEALGLSRKEIATALGKSPAQVTKYFAPLLCPPEAVELFQAGKLPLGHCYTISQSPEPLATLKMLLGGATRDQAASVNRKAKPKTDSVRLAAIKVALPSGATVQLRGAEMNLDEALEAANEAVKLLKAAIAKGLNAKTAQAYWADTASN